MAAVVGIFDPVTLCLEAQCDSHQATVASSGQKVGYVLYANTASRLDMATQR